MTNYKFLHLSDGRIRSESGDCTWEIGMWQEIDGEPELCERGFHCCARLFDAFCYVQGSLVAEVETGGAVEQGDDKEAWQHMRLVRAWHWRWQDSAHLSARSMELLLPIFEAGAPGDKRPHEALAAFRRWIDDPTPSNQSAKETALRDAWDARAARDAWDAWDARDAWDAWAARAAWDAWAARDAWAAWAARDAWDAWAARAAWAARDARAARDAWAAAKEKITEELEEWMVARLAMLEPYVVMESEVQG